MFCHRTAYKKDDKKKNNNKNERKKRIWSTFYFPFDGRFPQEKIKVNTKRGTDDTQTDDCIHVYASPADTSGARCLRQRKKTAHIYIYYT